MLFKTKFNKNNLINLSFKIKQNNCIWLNIFRWAINGQMNNKLILALFLYFLDRKKKILLNNFYQNISYLKNVLFMWHSKLFLMKNVDLFLNDYSSLYSFWDSVKLTKFMLKSWNWWRYYRFYSWFYKLHLSYKIMYWEYKWELKPNPSYINRYDRTKNFFLAKGIFSRHINASWYGRSYYRHTHIYANEIMIWSFSFSDVIKKRVIQKLYILKWKKFMKLLFDYIVTRPNFIFFLKWKNIEFLNYLINKFLNFKLQKRFFWTKLINWFNIYMRWYMRLDLTQKNFFGKFVWLNTKPFHDYIFSFFQANWIAKLFFFEKKFFTGPFEELTKIIIPKFLSNTDKTFNTNFKVKRKNIFSFYSWSNSNLFNCWIRTKSGFGVFVYNFILKILASIEKFFFEKKSWIEFLSLWAFFYLIMFSDANKFFPFAIKQSLKSSFSNIIKSKFNYNLNFFFEKKSEINDFISLSDRANIVSHAIITHDMINFLFDFFFRKKFFNFMSFSNKYWVFTIKPKIIKFFFFHRNWDFVLYANKNWSLKKWFKYIFNIPISFLNSLVQNKWKHFAFDFHFFIWEKTNSSFYLKTSIVNFFKLKTNKLSFYNDDPYAEKSWTERIPSPVSLLTTQFLWCFYYNKKNFLLSWKWLQWRSARNKITYVIFNYLQFKFWNVFFFQKTKFERLASYGFFFWWGFKKFTINWQLNPAFNNILYYAISNISWPRVAVRWINNKIIHTSLWWYSIKSKNLSSTFISFFSWAYLLHHMLQLGHIWKTYSWFYQEFIQMIYNGWFILNILNAQLMLKWNIWLLFWISYLGGHICLISSFNVLIEGMISLYFVTTKNPYTRYIWLNGLFTNFWKVWYGLQWKILNGYSGREFLNSKWAKSLIWLWFVMKGLLHKLNIDINFFPSLITSGWVFLESSARFIPTVTTSNTASFIPTFGLDYYVVSNDYSLLSISFYINLLLSNFLKIWMLKWLEFSLYPSWLLGSLLKFQFTPFRFSIKMANKKWKLKWAMALFRWTWYLFFDKWSDQISEYFCKIPVFWWEVFFEIRKLLLWRYIYFFKNKYTAKLY